MAGRQGFVWAVSRNTNKDGRVSRKPWDNSSLAFSDSFVGCRPFASAFAFFQRNVTRNDTRRERLPEFPRRDFSGVRSKRCLQEWIKPGRC